jgi:hypothetical protein
MRGQTNIKFAALSNAKYSTVVPNIICTCSIWFSIWALSPYTAFTDWSFQQKHTAFSVRNKVNLYAKCRLILIFQGLIPNRNITDSFPIRNIFESPSSLRKETFFILYSFLNSIHILAYYAFHFHFNIILPSMSTLPNKSNSISLSEKCCMHAILPNACNKFAPPILLYLSLLT